MRSTRVRFYFDYISPNAYVAWTQLPALARRHGAALVAQAQRDDAYLDRFLGGKDPIDPAAWKTWSAPLTRSAVRARQPRRSRGRTEARS